MEAEEEKKRQADKAEEERIAEIAKRLEMKKKAQADQKRQQELERKMKEEEGEKKKQEDEKKKIEVEAAKRKRAEQVVPKEVKLTKPAVMAPVMSVQQVVQPAIEVRTLIKAATPSIEAAASLVSMPFTSVSC